MSKQNPTVEAKVDKPRQPSPQNGAVAEAWETPAALPAFPTGLLGAADASNRQRQMDPVVNIRLLTAQRQHMIGHLGLLQGNRHIQRLATPLENRLVPALRLPEPEPALTAPDHKGLPQNGGQVNPKLQPNPAPAHQVSRFALPGLDAIKEKAAEYAHDIPGYSLLTVILGRDPIADKPVTRDATNLIRGVLGLAPGGERLFQQLEQEGAINDTVTWLEQQLAKLNLSFETVKELLKRAWDSLSAWDLLNPFGAFNKVKNVFMPLLIRLKNFAVAVGEKVLEFAFAGAMKMAGPMGGKVMEIIQGAGSALGAIIKDPIGFLSNLISGIKQGLQGFVTNIGTHLKKGLMTWLFGALANTDIELPATLDLKGLLSLALQLLGLTWANIRSRAVKLLGEKAVGYLEGAFEIFKIIQTEGLGGLWEFIKEQVSNLKEVVIGGLKEMVTAEVIKAGVQWLIGILGGPAGAFVKAVKAVYDIIMWFVNNGSQLMALVEAVIKSISAIAAGSLGQAVTFIEQSLAKTIPVVISFLASLLGLGDLSGKIKNIIQKIQSPINKAIEWLLAKAKALVKKIGKALGFGKEKNEGRGENGTNSEDVKSKVRQELASLLNSPVASSSDIQPIITSVYNKYKPEGLKYLDVVEDSKKSGHFKVVASASAEEEVGDVFSELGIEVGDLLPLVSKSGFGKTSLTAYMIVGNETVNLGSHENTKEEDLEKPERHAEKQLLSELDDYWEDYARKRKLNQIVIQITRSPCADCSLVLREFVEAKRAEGYKVTLTVRTLSLYGGVKKDEEGELTPRFEATRIALTDFKEPIMSIEPWDIFALLEEKGIRIDSKIMTPVQQAKLKQRIEEVKTVVAGIEKVKAGTK